MIGVLHRRLDLQHIRHTGDVLHYRHTSYRALLLIVFVGIAFMTWFSQYAHTQALDLEVTARRNAPTPDAIPFISTPATTTETLDSRVEINGTCPKNTTNYVNIYNWSRLIGTVSCSSDGTFSALIWVVYGNNRIQVSAINITGQETNRSIVTVIRKVRPAAPARPAASSPTPLQLTTDDSNFDRSDSVNLAASEGLLVYTADQEFQWHLAVSGGKAPYRVVISWGDGTENTYTAESAQQFMASHTYKKKQVYAVSVVAQDTEGRSAQYNFVATTPILQAAMTGVSSSTSGNTGFGMSGQISDQALLYITYALVGLFIVSLLRLPVVKTELTRLKYYYAHPHHHHAHHHRHHHG